MLDVAIPQRMQDLPRYQQYVVPWIVPWTQDPEHGLIPCFAANNEQRRNQAIIERTCPMCGLLLPPKGETIAFLGDIECCKNRMFEEPAMHEECARFAAATCPWMSHKTYDRPSDPLELPLQDEKNLLVPWARRAPARPEVPEFYLFLCHYYLPWKVGESGIVWARAGLMDSMERLDGR